MTPAQKAAQTRKRNAEQGRTREQLRRRAELLPWAVLEAKRLATEVTLPQTICETGDPVEPFAVVADVLLCGPQPLSWSAATIERYGKLAAGALVTYLPARWYPGE